MKCQMCPKGRQLKNGNIFCHKDKGEVDRDCGCFRDEEPDDSIDQGAKQTDPFILFEQGYTAQQIMDMAGYNTLAGVYSARRRWIKQHNKIDPIRRTSKRQMEETKNGHAT